MTEPTFTKVNRFFVLSFENENDKTSFSKYYVPNVQIKDIYVLIDGKRFFLTCQVKNDEETYEQIIKMGRKNVYMTGTLLDYEYFSKYYKLFAIDLSKQIELENPDLKQQINFIGRLEREWGATMFFIIEKSEETTFEFSQNAATAVWFWVCIKMETQKIANLLGNADNESSKFATTKWYVINVKITCVTHINNEYVDNGDILDIIMPMYNLIEYTDNYSDISESLCQLKETNKIWTIEILLMLLQLIHHLLNTSFFKPLIDADNGIFKDVKRAVPLKKLSNFWRSLEMPME